MRFPKDCWNKNCHYFKFWDLSVYDRCCYCDLLEVECDACDEDMSFLLCPLKLDEEGRSNGTA